MRISAPEPPRCPRCGGEHLTRLMSRFARLRSEDERLESLADPSQLGEVDEEDPRSVARFMKKMGGDLGEDAGEDWDEMTDEAVEEWAPSESETAATPASPGYAAGPSAYPDAPA